jgi:hypothetical protein
LRRYLYGTRRMNIVSHAVGYRVNRKRGTQRLMRQMGLSWHGTWLTPVEDIRSTSLPYLLRGGVTGPTGLEHRRLLAWLASGTW